MQIWTRPVEHEQTGSAVCAWLTDMFGGLFFRGTKTCDIVTDTHGH